ncbi:MAG: CAP domain-containing protein [Clostridium sp.]|nr:CAP domain-containing protein [Clostridium sp.]
MKKPYITLVLTAALTLSSLTTAYGGQWLQDAAGWKYQNDDTSFHVSGWQWIDGKCYYFTPEGYCLINTVTPDGYTVDASGAWIVNGAVQVRELLPAEGWNNIGGLWKYHTGKEYVTSSWKTIDGKRYYFDSSGIMLTGFQYIGGDRFYFYEDGSLRTTSFVLDDIRYVVGSNGIITDEMDEFDWFSDNYSNYYNSDYDDISDYSYDSYEDYSYSYSDDGGSGNESGYAYDVFQIVNSEREKKNLDPLEWDDELAACAQERAYEIRELFSHTRPDGSDCFTILKEEGITYTSCGENIASGQRTPEAVMTAWMNSSGHKKNILKTSFDRMGVGCAYINGTYYWVQIFTNTP